MSFLSSSPRDWPEDFTHENGQYMCGCRDCGERFIGYKRRVTCKVCATKNKARWDALTPEQRAIEEAAQMKDVQEWMKNRVDKDGWINKDAAT